MPDPANRAHSSVVPTSDSAASRQGAHSLYPNPAIMISCAVPRCITCAVAFAAIACGGTTEPVRPAAVIVAPAADTLTPGSERQLTARVVNLAGDTVAAEGTLWSSSAPDVAWVGPDGKVTAVAFGSATITALVSDEHGAAAIRVQRTFSARSVVVGPRTVCVLDLTGQAWCFGDNDTGQLGLGNAGVARPTLTSPVLGGHTFTTIGVAPGGVCGLDPAGKVWCWGDRGFLGQVRTSSSVPVLADTVRTYDVLAVGSHVCGVAAGVPYCWGETGSWLGLIEKIYDTPVFTSITIGFSDQYEVPACALTAQGQASCGSFNDFAFFGSDYLPGTGTFAQVVIGRGFRCGRYVDGHAVCDGRNDTGQLGNGTTADSSGSPTPLPGTWTMLAAGESSACGLATDGTALCWGANESGQLGTGDSTASLVPVAVASPEKFRTISTAGTPSLSYGGGSPSHRTCAITTSDVLFCWGAGLPARPAALGY